MKIFHGLLLGMAGLASAVVFLCGTAEHPADVAIAAPEAAEQNPLRSYQPSPGL
jgi:hypothetical protein